MRTKTLFLQKYYHEAARAVKHSGIPVLFALAQAALESGWGRNAPGYMLFGLKKGSGKNYGAWKGTTQLITTTEYHKSPNKNYPYIYPGYPVKMPSGLYKYKVKTRFRSYISAYHAFGDWSGMIRSNPRYKEAFKHRDDPYSFAKAIAQAGYATDPNYVPKIHSIMRSISTYIKAIPLANTKKNFGFPILMVLAGLGLVLGNYKLKKQ